MESQYFIWLLKMKYKYLQSLLLLIFGLLFYSFALDKFPGGYSTHEALIGWRSFLVNLFGVDEFGRKLPLVFYSQEGLQLPVQIYFSSIFGGSESMLFIRLQGVVAGAFAAALVYLITLEIGFSRRISAYSAVLMLLTPWLFWMSRISSPHLLGFGLFLITFYLILKKSKFAYVSFLLAILSSTVAWWFAVPFFVLLHFSAKATHFSVWVKLRSILGRKISRTLVRGASLSVRSTSKSLVSPKLLLPLLLLVFIVMSGVFVDAGFNLILRDFSFFRNEVVISGINQMIGEEMEHGIPLLGDIFYNKSLIIFEFIVNYLNHLSPHLLFGRGTGDIGFGMTASPLLLLSTLPLVIFGVKVLYKSKYLSLLVVWLLVSIFPSAMYGRGINPERFIFALLPIAILSGAGFAQVRSTVLKALLAVLIVSEFSFSVYQTWIYDQEYRNKIWHTDPSRLADEISELEGSIWLTDAPNPNPGIYLAYFWKVETDETNLTDQPSKVFWINKVRNVTIGDFEKLTNERQKYEWLVLSKNEMKTLRLSEYEKQIGDYFIVKQ